VKENTGGLIEEGSRRVVGAGLENKSRQKYLATSEKSQRGGIDDQYSSRKTAKSHPPLDLEKLRTG
jgi:hypothetical protein